MTKTTRSPLMLPGRAWALIFGIRVMDPDGWRKDDTIFHETPITYADFRERVWGSTVRDVSYVAALPDTDDDREALRQRTHRGLSGNFLVMRGGPKNGEVIGWVPGVACVYVEAAKGLRFRTHLYEPRPKDGVCYYLGATCWIDPILELRKDDGEPYGVSVLDNPSLRRMAYDMRTLESALAQGYRRYTKDVNDALKSAGVPSTAVQESVLLDGLTKVPASPKKLSTVEDARPSAASYGRRRPIVAVQVPPKKDDAP